LNKHRLRFPLLSSFLLLVVSTGLLLYTVLRTPPIWMLDIGRPGDGLFISNFFAPETNEDGTTFRWSSPDAQVRLPGIAEPVALTLRMYGTDAPPSGDRLLRLNLHAQPFASFAVTPGWRDYRVLLPFEQHPSLTDSVVPVTLATTRYCPPIHDSRVLGVPLDYVRITPLTTTTSPGAHLRLTLLAVWGLTLLIAAVSWLRPAMQPAHHQLLIGGVVAAGVVVWAWIHPYSLALVVTPPLLLLATVVLVVGKVRAGLTAKARSTQREEQAQREDGDDGPATVDKHRTPAAAIDTPGKDHGGHMAGVPHSPAILQGRLHLLLLLLLDVLAHAMLFAPIGVTWRGSAALVILMVPGVLLGWYWFRTETSRLVLLFLGACGGVLLYPLLLLLLQALPGALPAWLLLLCCDGLTLLFSGLLLPHCKEQPSPCSMLHAPCSMLHAPCSLLLVVLLGALLRFPFLGTSEFEGDEARAMLMAVGVMHGQDDILLLHKKGPMEIVLPPGPMVLTGEVNEWTARLPFALASTAMLLGVAVLAHTMRAGPHTKGQSTQKAAQEKYPSTILHAPCSMLHFFPAALLAVDGFLVAYGRIVQYQSVVVLMMVGAVWCGWRFYHAPAQAQRYLTAAAVMAAVGLLAHYDYMFVLPVLAWLVLAGGIRAGWRGREWIHALALPVLIGGGLLLSFYLPFVLHENFQGTLAYLGQRTGEDGALLSNNLPGYHTIATFYNTTYQINGLGSVLAAALLVWLVIYVRPRLAGWLLAIWWLAGVLVLVFAADWLQVTDTLNVAIVVFALPLAALILSPATPLSLRVLLLWFAPPFLAESFLISDPRTHFYTMDTAAALLIGLALAQFVAWLHSRPRLAWVRIPLAAGGAGLLTLATVYMVLVFVRQMPEYKRTFPAARPDIYRASYGDDLPGGGHYGHPHRDGWKAIGELYAQGVLQGTYYSNQMERISGWYTRGAFRCSQQPDYYFLGTWAAGESDMAIPVHTIRKTYDYLGCVLVDHRNMMDVYSRQPQTDAPQVLHLAEYVRSFDNRPLRPFPIQQPLARAVPQHTLDARWQQGVVLRGYDLKPPRLAPGETTTLLLTWQVEQPLPPGYTVVVQMQDAPGNPAGSAIPLCQTEPSTIGQAAGTVTTPFALTLPADAAAGGYAWSVGLRHATSGEWLPLQDGAERLVGIPVTSDA
jgi:hypothetical protein